jgi:succinate dehydrogenase/fumarate reductase flavoprotein subunit
MQCEIIVTAEQSLDTDVLVVGSGAAGLAAAVTAAARGLRVMVAEKEATFGGTTAYSAGVIWVPGSRHARDAGLADSPEAALEYLAAEGGNRLDRDKAETYLARAPGVLDWFEGNTHVRYALSPAWPDYHPDRPGGAQGGRSLGPLPFDGRRLGARFRQLRQPLATTTILGGMMLAREDIPHFYNLSRSGKSAGVVARRVLRYAADRLTHPRGTRLSNGNALVAMLALSAFERGVDLRLGTRVTDLTTQDGRVTGALLDGPDGRLRVTARAGVILASGGFPGDADLRRRLYGHVAAGHGHVSAAPASNTGDGLRLGIAAGARLIEDQIHPAAWTPVSLVPQTDGTTLPFPHFLDRGKPGYIAVDRRGHRFVNEARSYHDFVPAMVEACRDDAQTQCHLICDAKGIRAFGLGRAPPFPGRLAPWIDNGYLVTAPDIAGLAARCGIDSEGLARTLAAYNVGAVNGIDPQFGKGGDAYQRFNGSARQAPNPCVAPIRQGPFFAVRLVPGDIGTFVGLRTDSASRALGPDDRPIPGLYVVGNDAASFMGGAYPGAGITIGPALVFGHIAGETVALPD